MRGDRPFDGGSNCKTAEYMSVNLKGETESGSGGDKGVNAMKKEIWLMMKRGVV